MNKKLFVLAAASFAVALAFPAGAAITQKAPPGPTVATVKGPTPAPTIVAAKADKTQAVTKTNVAKADKKAAKKASKKAAKKDAKAKKTGTGFKLKTAAPIMA